MKCTCERCDGSGEIECVECHSSGVHDVSIENAHLHDSMKNYVELVALKEEANRVIREARQLMQVRPESTCSYLKQLKETLAILNEKANKVAKEK